jgi:hypothetical protein
MLVLSKMTKGMKYSNDKIDEASGPGLGTVSVDFLVQKLAGQSEHLRESLKSEILGAISETRRAAEVIEPKPMKIASSRRRTLKEKLLENLSYPDMLFRERSVVSASETTFRWIFERENRPDRPWASFCEWLEAPDKQLYWITGKPGSGKSTLMKFITEEPNDDLTTKPGKSHIGPRYLPFLQTWAAGLPLVVASYYFWAIGSPMQRSKEGMLRTLLHGLLSQADPEVIATVMPESWEALHLFDEDPRPYTESSLQSFLSRTIQHMCRSTKICLFIDGLDEFKGKHDDLILYLSDVLQRYPIKVCVSSRQWQVFEDAFHDEPSLRLQDLTLSDMMGYVQSKLYAQPAFALLKGLDKSFADKLHENIALRADGVFLWLVLVVESLRKGIAAGDRVSDLQTRLDHLPQDLEALFERILDELDPEYLDHAIQYFELMKASRDVAPLNVMVFSYADEDDEKFGLSSPVGSLDRETYENRKDQLKRRLNSRCMGLLEITEQAPSTVGVFVDASQSRVNYLHKTFGDYIARDEVHERLDRRAGRGSHQAYDPHLRLCSAGLAFVKSNPFEPLSAKDSMRSDTFAAIIKSSLVNCLCHAAAVQEPGIQSMIRLVDELGNFYEANSHQFNRPHHADIAYHKPIFDFSVHNGGAFVSFVIHCEVVEYIRVKAQQRSQTLKLWHKVSAPVRKQRRRPTRATDGWSDLNCQLTQAVVLNPPSPAIVELLLGRGADFQYKDPVAGVSNWELALVAYIYHWHKKSKRVEKSEEIVTLMIKYGAPTERKDIMRTYKKVARQAFVAKVDNSFISNVEQKLKTIKQELNQ